MSKMFLFLFVTTVITGCSQAKSDWNYAMEPISLRENHNFTNNIISKQASDNIISQETSDLKANNSNKKYTIDLPDVLKLCHANNLEIALVQERIHEAYAQTILAKQLFLPTVLLSASYVHHNGIDQNTDGTFEDEVDKQLETASYKVYGELKVGEAIYENLIADERYEASKFALQSTALETKLTAVSIYFNLVLYYIEAEILQDAIRFAENFVAESESYLQLGKGARGAILQAKAQLAQNKTALAQTQKNIQIASAQLVQALRLSTVISLVPEDMLKEPINLVDTNIAISELIEKAYKVRPEIHQGKHILAAFEKERNAAIYAPLFPTVFASAQLGTSGGKSSKLKSQEIYSASVGWEIGPGGIFDLGRIEETDSKYKQAQIKWTNIREGIAYEIQQIYYEIQADKNVMEYAKEAIIIAEEALKISTERQKLGVGIPLEVIKAQEDLIKARLTFLYAVIGHNKGQYRLHMLVNYKPS